MLCLSCVHRGRISARCCTIGGHSLSKCEIFSCMSPVVPHQSGHTNHPRPSSPLDRLTFVSRTRSVSGFRQRLGTLARSATFVLWTDSNHPLRYVLERRHPPISESSQAENGFEVVNIDSFPSGGDGNAVGNSSGDEMTQVNPAFSN